MPKNLLLPFKSSELINGVNFVGGAAITGAPHPKPYQRNKTKYSCSCGHNLWGKPDMHIICGECEEKFEVVKKKV